MDETRAQADVAHLELQSAIHAISNLTQGEQGGRPPASVTTSRQPTTETVALKDELRISRSQILQLQKNVNQLKQELEKKDAQLAQITVKFDKEAATARDLQSALKAAEVQLGILKKEIVVIQHNMANAKTTPSAAKAPDAKLAALQEQLANANAELELLRGAPATEQLKRLSDENASLLRQRAEFLSCLKKQNKLIDILKRQCLHLEAAKLLQFTEAEFTAALESRPV